jgi:hypothetical protein
LPASVRCERMAMAHERLSRLQRRILACLVARGRALAGHHGRQPCGPSAGHGSRGASTKATSPPRSRAWRRRAGPKWSTDRAAPLGSARACALAYAVRWRGTAGCGSMGSAGSSLASPGGDLALAGHTRPHGCPKDPRLFKRSVTSPRPNGVVPNSATPHIIKFITI